MARRKRSRPARMESAFSSPDQPGLTSYQMSNIQGQDSFDAMEVESDGEVSSDSIRIITESTDATESADTAMVQKVYHQSAVSEHDNSTYIWKLPVAPLGHNPQRVHKSKDHRIAKAYQRFCGLISKNWQTSPGECIPADLRARTPYSLAMLDALRRLSSYTKRDLELAQSMLHDAWDQRMLQQNRPLNGGVLLTETFDTVRGAKRNIPSFCEARIQENVFGLMIEDVFRALERNHQRNTEHRSKQQAGLKTPKQIARQQKKLARQLAKSEALQLSVAQRMLKRRRKDRVAKSAANQAFDFGDELVDIQFGDSAHPNIKSAFAAPPNSPVATFDRSSAFAIDTALREIGSRHNEQTGALNQDEEVLYKPSKRDRHEDAQISRVLDSIDMGGRKGLRRKRLRMLEAGGLSRKPNQSVSMPSEKLTLDTLSPLQAMAPATSEDELARMGQLPLPDTPSFTLPMR